jgi:hypothetical protein
MTRTERPLIDPPEAFSALVAIGAGAALVPIRGSVDNAVTVLVLAAVVSLCGALGGWRAGIWAAVAAGVSFNFFHTQPYLSLRIHDADDVLTTVVLMVVGLIAGATSAIGHRRQDQAAEAGSELSAVERVADLVAAGADPADVETAVRAELLGLLSLSGCRYELVAPGRSTLGRHGELTDTVRTFHDGGFELPSGGVSIPVLRAGEPVGFLVCEPTPGVAVSATRRRVAVTLADLLGASIANNPTNSRN